MKKLGDLTPGTLFSHVGEEDEFICVTTDVPGNIIQVSNDGGHHDVVFHGKRLMTGFDLTREVVELTVAFTPKSSKRKAKK